MSPTPGSSSHRGLPAGPFLGGRGVTRTRAGLGAHCSLLYMSSLHLTTSRSACSVHVLPHKFMSLLHLRATKTLSVTEHSREPGLVSSQLCDTFVSAPA